MKRKSIQIFILSIAFLPIISQAQAQIYNHVYNIHTGRPDLVLRIRQVGDTVFIGTDTIIISGGGSSLWTQTGSDIYYNTGNVGIGTATPGQALDVNGSIEIQGLNKLYINSDEAISNNGTTMKIGAGAGTLILGSTFTYINANTNGTIFRTGTSGIWFEHKATTGITYFQSGHKIGIGTTTPTETFEVSGGNANINGELSHDNTHAELYKSGGINYSGLPADTWSQLTGFTQGNSQESTLTDSTIIVGQGGDYIIMVSASLTHSLDSTDLNLGLFKNGSAQSDITTRQHNEINLQYSNLVLSGIITLTALDTLDIRVNPSKTGTVKLEHFNFSTHRFK